jgi:hypothetical protein
MSIQSSKNLIINKRKALLLENITFLKKKASDYKAARKICWELFKSKMNEDMTEIERTIQELNLEKEN